MPVCYCKNSGGYGRFLQVVEQKPVKPKVEEEQEAEIVAISAEYGDLYGCISSDDAMDACDECYTRIREAIKECRERGRHER